MNTKVIEDSSSIRNVYFYRVNLLKNGQEILIDSKDHRLATLRNAIIDIVEGHKDGSPNSKRQNLKNNIFVNSIDLSDEDNLHMVGDVFEYKDKYLFMRISKQKITGSLIEREYKNLKTEALLADKNENEEGIEAYTYLKLDYQTGILGIINQQGAPGVGYLNALFKKYSSVKYSLNFESIPNSNGIKLLYNGEDSKISSLEVELPIPNAEFLSEILNWNDSDTLGILSNDKLRLSIKLSAGRRGITTDSYQTQKVIRQVKRAHYIKGKLRAKQRTSETLRDYNIYSENFKYPVHIPFYTYVSEFNREVANSRRYYNSTDLIEKYKTGLDEAFSKNWDMLKAIANRDGNDGKQG